MKKITAGRDNLGEFAPKFAQLNDDVLFGEVWSREAELPARDRSLITVTALMAQGLTDTSFRHHLEMAKENGITRSEIAEILTHAAFYAGWPKAWAAFRMAKEVWAEESGGDAKQNVCFDMMYPPKVKLSLFALFQRWAQRLEALLPGLGNAVGIADFLNRLAADRIGKSAVCHPLAHRLRLINCQLRKQPGLGHLHIVVLIPFHQWQQPVRMLPPQGGNKHHISPAADKGILGADIFLCIAEGCLKIQLRGIANELIRVPPIRKQ